MQSIQEFSPDLPSRPDIPVAPDGPDSPVAPVAPTPPVDPVAPMCPDVNQNELKINDLKIRVFQYKCSYSFGLH